jgi:hypothetical protein
MKNTLLAFKRTAGFLFTLCLLVCFGFPSTATKPGVEKHPQRWEKLGQRKVNFKVDKDEIIVGRVEGLFTALQIKVRKGPVNMHRMLVHFRNGSTKEVELKNNFSDGDESRVIDLPGNVRVITKVVFWYDTKNFNDSKAIVELWGRH